MLKRKMFRDIRKNLSQYITIFLMVMIGVMAYSGIKSYMEGMKETADKFYSENNFQDLNILLHLNHKGYFQNKTYQQFLAYHPYML